ncbi:MAG: hypothetical protein RR415_07850 [Ruthenibacterium sp.]
MSKVRSKSNKSTELWLIEIFGEQGIKGWQRNYPVKGHPDFVFQKKRIAVFVDGCFWHGHDCRNTRQKKIAKIEQTSVTAIWLMIKRLLRCSKVVAGQHFEFGNVN